MAGIEFPGCKVLKATDLAIQVLVPECDATIWVPLSQIHDDSELWRKDQVGETGVLVLPEWLADAKGLT